MATEVVLPRLGLTQEDGTVVRWLKAEGSRVAKGEPLFEVMTDKATLEVEAPASGVLLRILVAEGGTVPVATPIAVIGEPDEAALHSALGAPGTGGRAHTAGGQAEAGRSGGAAANADRKADQRPIEAGSRAEVGAEWSQDTAAGNGPGRNVSAASPAPDPTGRVKISPRARALADAQGVDVRSLAGTGNSYDIPAYNPGSNFTTGAIGIAGTLMDRIGVSVSYVKVSGRSGISQDGVSGMLSYRF